MIIMEYYRKESTLWLEILNEFENNNVEPLTAEEFECILKEYGHESVTTEDIVDNDDDTCYWEFIGNNDEAPKKEEIEQILLEFDYDEEDVSSVQRQRYGCWRIKKENI